MTAMGRWREREDQVVASIWGLQDPGFCVYSRAGAGPFLSLITGRWLGVCTKFSRRLRRGHGRSSTRVATLASIAGCRDRSPSRRSADPNRRARFEREAKTIAGLRHPQIRTPALRRRGRRLVVHRHGASRRRDPRAPDREGPALYRAGADDSLRDPPGAVCGTPTGIIHRDLSRNATSRSRARSSSNFGLAKLDRSRLDVGRRAGRVDAHAMASLTRRRRHCCTLQYMAPEQVEGKPADARTDLWGAWRNHPRDDHREGTRSRA